MAFEGPESNAQNHTARSITPSEMSSLETNAINGYPEATLLAGATSSYNCHGYAWSMREGKSACWLEETKLHYYVDDHSFVQVATVDSAEVIRYMEQHSAVKSLVEPGKYESK
jgi:hypothetical protein